VRNLDEDLVAAPKARAAAFEGSSAGRRTVSWLFDTDVISEIREGSRGDPGPTAAVSIALRE
jgi:hypothetical protein